MSADVVIRFEDGDFVMAMEQVSCHHAGDSGSDDGNSHTTNP
jgi:hypothetical protein